MTAITRQFLTERFKLFGDEELLAAFGSGELTELAQDVAAGELRRRNLDVARADSAASVESQSSAEPGPGDVAKASAGADVGPAQSPRLEPVQGPATTSETPDASPPDLGSGDLVMVAHYLDPIEAEILRSRLEAEGVNAIIGDTNLVGVIPILSPVFGGVRVLVPESHCELAHKVIAAIERGDYALDDGRDYDPSP
jgi:hypothetical protein